MAIYSLTDLDVIGFGDDVETCEVPMVFPPVYSVRGSGKLLKLLSEEEFEANEIEGVPDDPIEWVRECTSEHGGFYFFDQPFPAKPGHAIYVGPDTQEPLYMSFHESADRTMKFYAWMRELGDQCYRAGKHTDALQAYLQSAGAGQNLEDFVRLLLVDTSEMHRSWLDCVQRHPDYDGMQSMDELCTNLRHKILSA